jgi:hypothetical protein
LGNGFAPNKKLPAGRRLTLKCLKPYTSPEIIALLFGNAQVSLALSNKYKAALNVFESVVPNHNVVCIHDKGDRLP